MILKGMDARHPAHLYLGIATVDEITDLQT